MFPSAFGDSLLTAGQTLPHPERLSEITGQAKVLGMVFRRKGNAKEQAKGSRRDCP